MSNRRAIYFFGEHAPLGVTHIPLQQAHFLNPNFNPEHFDFIVITSKRAIDSLEHFHYTIATIKLLCIGAKTAAYAVQKGYIVESIGKGYASDFSGVIKTYLKQGLKGLYLRPKDVANDSILTLVDSQQFSQAICYAMQCIESSKPLEKDAILLFAAPSQIRCFVKQFEFTKEHKVIVIGKTTLEALPKSVEYTVSDELSLDAMVQLANRYAKRLEN